MPWGSEVEARVPCLGEAGVAPGLGLASAAGSAEGKSEKGLKTRKGQLPERDTLPSPIGQRSGYLSSYKKRI